MKRSPLRGLSTLIISERGQVILAVVLLVLIPAALIFNTTRTVQTARDNMDVELRQKALLAEKVFMATTHTVLDDQEQLQEIVEELGMSSEEITGIDVLVPDGDNFRVFASLDREAVDQTSDALNNVIAWHQEETIAFQTIASNVLTVDQELRTGDGNERFWVVQSPLRDANGEKVALLSMKVSSRTIDELVARSVTDAMAVLIITVVIVVLLLATNSQLFRYTVLFRKLKEVDQMKDEFISIASHELRTPITAIRGYLEMVLDGTYGKLSDKAHDVLGRVQEGARRLNDLVEDLLNVSRIEQGRLQVELTPTDVRPVIDEVLQELHPLADEKHLAYTYDGPATLPTFQVNRDRFKQVLINLAGNAVKYTMQGSVTIHAEIRPDSLRITVADTDIGMTAEEQTRLFTKFYRVQNETTATIRGSGLGLWITKQIVELMHGTVTVESMRGTGSQFSITFPITTTASS